MTSIESEQLRAKQIDSLRQYFPTIKEKTRGSEYQIPLTLPSRRSTLLLFITLLPDFPRSPPLLSFPNHLHRFLDSNGFVLQNSHQSLSRWSVHASLGKTVYDVVQQFMKDPPQPASSSSSHPPPPSGSSSSSSGKKKSSSGKKKSSSSSSLAGTSHHTMLPPVPESFPELERKSTADLTTLLNDELAFSRFFEGLDCVRTMKKVRDDMANANENVARKNAAMEDELSRMEHEVGGRGGELSEKRRLYDEKLKRKKEVMKRFSTPALVEKLEDAANDAEKESDDLANSFLKGSGLSHSDFTHQFIEKRKLYHLRCAKKESLQMMAGSS